MSDTPSERHLTNPNIRARVGPSVIRPRIKAVVGTSNGRRMLRNAEIRSDQEPEDGAALTIAPPADSEPTSSAETAAPATPEQP